jgi:hypothetical protein
MRKEITLRALAEFERELGSLQQSGGPIEYNEGGKHTVCDG